MPPMPVRPSSTSETPRVLSRLRLLETAEYGIGSDDWRLSAVFHRPGEMASHRLLVVFRGLTVCLAHPQCSKESNLWAALLGIAERLALVKQGESWKSSIPRNSNCDSLRQDKHSGKQSGVVPPSKSPRSPVLPPELLPHIFKFLPEQSDIHTCALVCRLWHRCAIPILYRTPNLLSVESTRCFLSLINQGANRTLWPYAEFVRRIHFPLPINGSLRGDNNNGCEMLRTAYTSLFRLVVLDRERSEGAAAHQLFFDLSARCSNLEAIEESFGMNNSAGLLTQTVLQNLLRSCRNVATLTYQVGIPPAQLTGACTLLLEFFEGEGQPIWRGISSDVIRGARSRVLEKCRMTLNRLSTCMFLEAQYLALSAQRLLDQYALMYYRGFAGATDLNLDFVVRAAEKEAKHPSIGVESKAPADADSIALVLQAVRLLFHQPMSHSMPEQPIIVTSFPTRAFLETALGIFPPSGINSETVELISEIIEQYERLDADQPEVDLWFRWFRDIVVWQRAGIEMEGVKELLRKSMARMEVFRGMQRRFGMVFID
ncbi:uncharacterized protein SPPG_00545 [Spizellomyces punctatus DAOM BR117]|uniref:F-box domain-containing protein n=1 Tax=Spizellomyces punctatus (strain DAOM BR117) TaxID=645134 RepID=A0A0L0HVC3_SPIPD|nr:uncharacterized protein SPPG_00545 [Spizellomyces punctatus DAOM BR117]KND04845.1 hypothetical protein SPPG_00545 [Spizellomyces punctatus DAOM BR117]|eukprot:XP_016612884.1 hypothetical protein SPPG_00545 [Spizellomyces punctatus DAOM BR117]